MIVISIFFRLGKNPLVELLQVLISSVADTARPNMVNCVSPLQVKRNDTNRSCSVIIQQIMISYYSMSPGYG